MTEVIIEVASINELGLIHVHEEQTIHLEEIEGGEEDEADNVGEVHHEVGKAGKTGQVCQVNEITKRSRTRSDVQARRKRELVAVLDSKITMALPESVRIMKVTILVKITGLAKREMEMKEENKITTRGITMAGKPGVQAVVVHLDLHL
jgi:hypothetical protein